MKRIYFPLVKNESLIVYPDDISLFANTDIIGEFIVADYSGDLEFPEYVPPAPVGPAQLSPYAFKRLIGTELRLAIRAAAGTDPIIFDFLDLLNSADVIDFDDAVGGPKQGMGYLLAIGLISQSEYDRIMRREFP